jgi:hypothetical protein
MTNNTSSLRLAASGTQKRIRTTKKSVQIALFSHQRTYRPAEHERSSKSYTKADYRRFGDLRNYDIVKYSHLVANKVRSGERLTKEDLCLCTGLEAFLSPDVPKRIKKINKARKTHVEIILLAQEQGCGIDIISRVSRENSRSAVARAQNAAMACYSASD